MCRVVMFGVFAVAIGGCGGSDSVSPAGKPQLRITSGDGQTGTVGKALPQDIVAVVVGADGAPLPNVAVTWTPADGSGTIAPAAASTDAQGSVRATWTLDTVAGSQSVGASAEGASSPVSITATANADEPTQFRQVSGDGQSGPFGVTLATPVEVQLLDRYGNGVPGIGVSFAASHGSVTAATVTSGADGTASTRWRLPFTDGQDTLSASVSGDLSSIEVTATSRSTTRFVYVNSSSSNVCALTPEGYAYCWGHQCCQQLGLGDLDTSTAVLSPLPLAGGHLFTTVQLGGLNGCGLDRDQVVWCWGDQSYGELGTGVARTPSSVREPVQVAGGHHYTALSVGGQHACAVPTTGGLECWGDNLFEQAGPTNAGDFVLVPTAVPSPVPLTQLVAGQFHTCGLTADGSAYCWGSNQYGQLGVTSGTTACVNHAGVPCTTVPIPVAGGLHFTSLTASWFHSCGLTTDGHAYCWGQNTVGDLGDGTTTNRSTPVAVTGGFTFVSLSGRDNVTCGLTAEGAIYCWGQGANLLGGDINGQCPVSPGSMSTYPCQFGPVHLATTLTFRTMDMGTGQLCGIATDDVLYCWGFGGGGALGDGATDDRTEPTRVLRQP